MKHFRALGLSLAIALALGSLIASSASATAPEFGRCLKTAGGKFKNSKCTIASVPGEEKYEWFSGVIKNKFTTKIKEGTIATLETVGGTKITCTGETSSGEFLNAKEVGHMPVKFTGGETSGFKCESAGAGAGNIVTAPLGGPIGFETEVVPPTKNHIANELHSESGNIAEFTCVGIKVVVRGSVLHKIAANAMKLTATEKFTAAKGKQKPEHFAGGVPKEHVLETSTNGGPFEQSGQTITGIITGEEKVEASTIN
jgi:hypothetical protein